MYTVIFIIFGLIILIDLLWFSIRYGITPTPSSAKVIHQLLEEIEFSGNGPLLELGSGWGSILFSLQKKFPKADIIGYEISHLPFFFSRAVISCLHYKNIIVLRKDFFKASLEEASVIICYLYPGAMEKLKIKFDKELHPGTLVITHTFAIPGKKASKKIIVNDLYRTPIYVYQW